MSELLNDFDEIIDQIEMLGNSFEDYKLKHRSQCAIDQVTRMKVKYEYKQKYDRRGYGSGGPIKRELAKKYHKSLSTIDKWIHH